MLQMTMVHAIVRDLIVLYRGEAVCLQNRSLRFAHHSSLVASSGRIQGSPKPLASTDTLLKILKKD